MAEQRQENNKLTKRTIEIWGRRSLPGTTGAQLTYVRRFERTPLRSPSFGFISCSLYGRALSFHHTTSLQLKQRNLVERDVDHHQRVHDSSAVGVATSSTEVWSTTAFFSTCSSARRPTVGVLKKKVRSRWYTYQHFSSSSIA